MPRGSGKFKAKRGGGRSFSRHLELDEHGTAVAVDKRPARDKADDDEEDDEDDEEEVEESSESEEEEAPGAGSVAQPEMTRAERKALKKSANPKKKAPGEEEEDEDDDDLVNPNHVSSTSKKISNLNSPQPLSRREREAKEKQEAKERYWKMHLEGKTDQAKADLARLAKIRKDREEAQMKRKAEADAKQKEIEAKATAQGRRR